LSSPCPACRTIYSYCIQGVGGEIINPHEYGPHLFQPRPKTK
jgi:hypothetical protein